MSQALIYPPDVIYILKPALTFYFTKPTHFLSFALQFDSHWQVKWKPSHATCPHEAWEGEINTVCILKRHWYVSTTQNYYLRLSCRSYDDKKMTKIKDKRRFGSGNWYRHWYSESLVRTVIDKSIRNSMNKNKNATKQNGISSEMVLVKVDWTSGFRWPIHIAFRFPPLSFSQFFFLLHYSDAEWWWFGWGPVSVWGKLVGW